MVRFPGWFLQYVAGSSLLLIAVARLVAGGGLNVALPLLVAAIPFAIIGWRGRVNRLLHFVAGALISFTAIQLPGPDWIQILSIISGGFLVGLAVRDETPTLATLREGRLLELRGLLVDEGREAAVSRAQELTKSSRGEAEQFIDGLMDSE
jgi:hypothetical protein